MNSLKPIALAVAMLIATGAHAGEVYKCPDANGKIEYRDRPCDGVKGQKVQAKDNSVGTGSDLATIRAQDAEFKARQDVKQKAIDKANAENYRAAERAYYQERAHQDSQDLVNAIREGNNQRIADDYNSRLVPQRPVQVEVVNPPARRKPK